MDQDNIKEELAKSVGKIVQVVLSSKMETYIGKLQGFDEYSNLVMENAEEYEWDDEKKQHNHIKNHKVLLLSGKHINKIILSVNSEKIQKFEKCHLPMALK